MNDIVDWITIPTCVGAIYGASHWLDENLSDEAKNALTRTLCVQEIDKKQVAAALIEAFDCIYGYPLLRRRAFLTSALFTTIVTALFIHEFGKFSAEDATSHSLGSFDWFVANYGGLLSAYCVNILSDYGSLFLIRRWLNRMGTSPVIALITGSVIGLTVVYLGNLVRLSISEAVARFIYHGHAFWNVSDALRASLLDHRAWFALPATAVFLWLPLFAIGIAVIRAFVWFVGRTQWLLKDGEQRPLKAIGFVAAATVLLVSIVWQVGYKFVA